MTIELAGDERSSKSPIKVASDKKAPVVSKDAFKSTELDLAIPVRLKGL